MGVTVGTLVANKSKGSAFLGSILRVSALTESALVYRSSTGKWAQLWGGGKTRTGIW